MEERLNIGFVELVMIVFKYKKMSILREYLHLFLVATYTECPHNTVFVQTR